MRSALVPVALGAALAAAFSPQPVFQAYVGYPPCYRQPVLVIAGSNVLAFAEGRNNTYCSGTSDGYPKYINLRVSTDGGHTFGALQTLYEGNIDFLSAVYDPATQVAWLTIQLGSSNVLITSSKDGGLTWSTPAPLAFKTKYPGAIPGVGHGIVIRSDLCGSGGCASKAGRLLLPFVCHSATPPPATRSVRGDVACANCYSCLLVSDDHGASWATAAISTQDGSREAALVQLLSNATASADAVVYANERNMGNATGHKWHALSVDGGDSFTLFGTDPGLVDSVTANWTGIVSGGARFDTINADGSVAHRVLLTTPLSPSSRADMGLYVSTDETATWSNGTLLQAGPAGYSDLYQLNATHMAMLFENGAQEFSQQISFAVFDTSVLPA